MKQLLRDAIATHIKTQIRQAEKYKGNKTIYNELEKEIIELKNIENKISLKEEKDIIEFFKTK